MKTNTVVNTVQKLLSNKEFDVEFHGYLSNHAKHAIVALHGLNAPESRIQQYWDQYTTLTPYHLSLHKVEQQWKSLQPISSRAEWYKIRGSKILWQEQVVFLRQQLETTYHGNVRALVQSYAPDLLDGIAGSLTHGIIHLGWAIDAQNDWMICEGLAYLNFCYLGVDPTKFSPSNHNDDSLLDALVRVANVFEKDNLYETWVAKSKESHDETFHPELVPAGFQWQLSKILLDAHSVATELPTFLYDSDKESTLFESLYKDVVILYLATVDKNGHGSFLILHALTSLWGFEQTVKVIDDWELTLQGLRQYYATLICLLATSGGFPKSNALQNLGDVYVNKIDDKDFDWTKIVEAGIAETEEHNIKLVYVCRELWKRYGRWSGFSQAAQAFTVTPNIGPQQTSFKVTQNRKKLPSYVSGN